MVFKILGNDGLKKVAQNNVVLLTNDEKMQIENDINRIVLKFDNVESSEKIKLIFLFLNQYKDISEKDKIHLIEKCLKDKTTIEEIFYIRLFYVLQKESMNHDKIVNLTGIMIQNKNLFKDNKRFFSTINFIIKNKELLKKLSNRLGFIDFIIQNNRSFDRNILFNIVDVKKHFFENKNLDNSIKSNLIKLIIAHKDLLNNSSYNMLSKIINSLLEDGLYPISDKYNLIDLIIRNDNSLSYYRRQNKYDSIIISQIEDLLECETLSKSNKLNLLKSIIDYSYDLSQSIGKSQRIQNSIFKLIEDKTLNLSEQSIIMHILLEGQYKFSIIKYSQIYSLLFKKDLFLNQNVEFRNQVINVIKRGIFSIDYFFDFNLIESTIKVCLREQDFFTTKDLNSIKEIIANGINFNIVSSNHFISDDLLKLVIENQQFFTNKQLVLTKKLVSENIKKFMKNKEFSQNSQFNFIEYIMKNKDFFTNEQLKHMSTIISEKIIELIKDGKKFDSSLLNYVKFSTQNKSFFSEKQLKSIDNAIGKKLCKLVDSDFNQLNEKDQLELIKLIIDNKNLFSLSKFKSMNINEKMEKLLKNNIGKELELNNQDRIIKNDNIKMEEINKIEKEIELIKFDDLSDEIEENDTDKPNTINESLQYKNAK